MKRSLVIGLGVILLAGLALSTLPARLLPRIVDTDRLRLSGLSGTLLHGRAARVLVSTPAGFVHLGHVAWDVDALSLLTLAPKVAVDSAWGLQRAELTVESRSGETIIEDLDAALDARLLRTLAPLAVDGRVSLLFDRLVLAGSTPLEASGRLVWQSAIWRTNTREHSLGTYVAQVDGSDGEIQAAVDTLRGPVTARGAATLRGTRYDLELRVGSSDGALASEVERALQLFATPEEDGYLLRLDGDLAVAP